MRNVMLRLLALVAVVLLIGGAAPVQGQGAFAHGAVVALQGTPHLWFADEHGVLHWGGDTRALAGKHILWSNRVEVSLDQLRTLPVGDPWLSAGLLKDGDPIYLVKWETDWPQPQLLHIQSIGDVELFGINGSNYGNFVIDRPAWEARYGFSAADLQRGVLASAVPATTPAQPSTPFGDGERRVGIDIVPGTYLTSGTDSCYWQRSSGFSGTVDDILANDIPQGQAVVTILPSDVGFTSQGCGTWVLADTVKPAQPSTQIGDGEWRVGIDIAPGTYLTPGTDSCYWQRSSGFSGTVDDILANDIPQGQAVVTILPSDVGFTSQRCGTWTKQ